MEWLPPWLGRAYSAIRLEFGNKVFTIDEAARSLGFSRPKATLTLSRLAAAGWLAKPFSRGRYIAVDPDVVFSSVVGGGLTGPPLASKGAFPCLQAALGGIIRLYGERLVSLAVFGSTARGDGGATSDIDLLVVAEGLSRSYSERLAELEPVSDACSNVNRVLWAERGEYHLLDAVVLAPEELLSNSLFLLDMTRDALVVFDRRGTLRGVLEGLRRRLAETGSRRVETPAGNWYWELKPGAVSGVKAA